MTFIAILPNLTSSRQCLRKLRILMWYTDNGVTQICLFRLLSTYCHVQNKGSSLNELYLKRRVKILWHEMLCTYLSLFKANNHEVNPTQISSLFNLLHHWERAVRTPEEALHDEYDPLKNREELTFAPQKSSFNHNFLFDLNFICCY